MLASMPELAPAKDAGPLPTLVGRGPHVRVSGQLGFAERIHFLQPRVAALLADTEFNLTLFAEDQVCWPGTDLGDGIQSLWTCTSCVSDVPGHLFGLPVANARRSNSSTG